MTLFVVNSSMEREGSILYFQNKNNKMKSILLKKDVIRMSVGRILVHKGTTIKRLYLCLEGKIIITYECKFFLVSYLVEPQRTSK